MTGKFDTREQWLMAAVEIFRDWFKEEETPIPDTVRVSVGFAKGAKTNTIGWCYRKSAAADEIPQIFVSPELDSTTTVLATLLHELCHAATDGHGHDKVFGKIARALGLTGKLTATTPSEELIKELEGIAKDLGTYPHAKLSHVVTHKGKHNHYNMKMVCQNCDFFIASVARKKVEEWGAPEHCGEEMIEG